MAYDKCNAAKHLVRTVIWLDNISDFQLHIGSFVFFFGLITQHANRIHMTSHYASMVDYFVFLPVAAVFSAITS